MRTLAALSLVTFALAACGSDDKKERGEVHVASILPKTGTLSTLYPLTSASVSLAARNINAAGGVLGNDIVFDEYDEAAAIDVANTLVAGDTQVWVGPYLSDNALAIAPIAGDAQRLMITPIAGAAAYSSVDDHDYAFRGLESPIISAVGSASASYELGKRTAACLHLNFATGNEQCATFAQTFTDKGGSLTTNRGYTFDSTSPGSFDAQAQLDAVFAGNPDVIFLYGGSADAVTLLSTWNKSDWNGTWVVGLLLGTPELAAAVGASKMAGVMTYGAIPADPANQAVIVDDFAAFSGITLSGSNINLMNSIVNTCYLAALAIEKGGAYDGRRARDALRPVANAPGEQVVGTISIGAAMDVVRDGRELDFIGLTAPIEYDENGDFPSDLAERRFNANGQLDTLRVLQPGVDF